MTAPSGPLMYACELDDRVSYSPALAGIWATELRHWTPQQVMGAIGRYATSPLYVAPNGWHAPLSISTLLQILRREDEARAARAAALTAPAVRAADPSPRVTDPDRWTAMVQAGEALGLEEREHRGVLTDAQRARLTHYRAHGRMPEEATA